MVSFGIGLGSFMDGVNQGMQFGKTIKTAVQDRKIRKMEREAIDAAEVARQQDGAKGIMAPQPGYENAPGSGPYSMHLSGDGGGAAAPPSAESGTRAAPKTPGTFMDYYRKVSMPKLIEGYLKNGQPERASQLQSYLDSEDGKGKFKDWASAAQRFAMGDNEGGFKRLADLNKRLDNNIELDGYEEVKDEKTGSATGGWRVKWKDADTGKAFTQDFDTADDFARTALWAMSPEQQAQARLSEMTAAQKARAEAAAAARKAATDFNYDVKKQGYGAILADQRDDRQFKRQQQRDASLYGYDAARDATRHGYSMEEDTNNLQMRAALKLSDDSGEKPEDVRKSLETITKRLAETDMSFSKLSPDEQTARAVAVLQGQRNGARGVIGGGAPAASGGRGAIPPLY
jgi:hypothetical protein